MSKIEYVWIIFNMESKQRVTEFICDTKKECKHKIEYWLAGNKNYKPVKVKLEICDEKNRNQ